MNGVGGADYQSRNNGSNINANSHKPTSPESQTVDALRTNGPPCVGPCGPVMGDGDQMADLSSGDKCDVSIGGRVKVIATARVRRRRGVGVLPIEAIA